MEERVKMFFCLLNSLFSMFLLCGELLNIKILILKLPNSYIMGKIDILKGGKVTQLLRK